MILSSHSRLSTSHPISFPSTLHPHTTSTGWFRCSAGGQRTGFFTRLGRLLKEKANSDVEKIFPGFSKTRENLAETDRVLDELEEKALLVSDFGRRISMKVVDSLRGDILAGKLKSGSEIKEENMNLCNSTPWLKRSSMTTKITKSSAYTFLVSLYGIMNVSSAAAQVTEDSSTMLFHLPNLVLLDLDPVTAKLLVGITGPILSAFGFLFIVRIVMSWYPKLPVDKFPYVIAFAPTEPILEVTRRVIQPVGGVDVTPVVWFGLLSFLNEILVGPQGLLVLLSQQVQ